MAHDHNPQHIIKKSKISETTPKLSLKRKNAHRNVGFIQHHDSCMSDSTSTVGTYTVSLNNRVPITTQPPPSNQRTSQPHGTFNSMTVSNPEPQSLAREATWKNLTGHCAEVQLCGHGKGIWLDKHMGKPKTGSLTAQCDETQEAGLLSRKWVLYLLGTYRSSWGL